MTKSRTQISVRGIQTDVPAIHIDDAEIVIKGGWLKVATVKDEDYFEGIALKNPEKVLTQFRTQSERADILSFFQRLPETSQKFEYPVYWDNAAALPITTYSKWWESLSQETRRNVRLAGKRGLVVSAVPYNDELVHGIMGIYNESPFRQGRRFWHYGKDFETVKRENATYADRSQFIAAYSGSELVGFIKMVYVDNIASIMQILSKTSHQDKRPTNALVAKAVEICSEKQISYLVYCKYVYHQNHQDALTEFKRRNGFQPISYPRYFVPLTVKGRLAIALKLHLGITAVLPQSLVAWLLKIRSKYYAAKLVDKRSENRELSPTTGDSRLA
jgi:hypothetical protein